MCCYYNFHWLTFLFELVVSVTTDSELSENESELSSLDLRIREALSRPSNFTVSSRTQATRPSQQNIVKPVARVSDVLIQICRVRHALSLLNSFLDIQSTVVLSCHRSDVLGLIIGMISSCVQVYDVRRVYVYTYMYAQVYLHVCTSIHVLVYDVRGIMMLALVLGHQSALTCLSFDSVNFILKELVRFGWKSFTVLLLSACCLRDV